MTDQFSAGGVRQYLLNLATAHSLVGFCWYTPGYSISGEVEGYLDSITTFRDAMKQLEIDGRVEYVISTSTAVHKTSYTTFSILQNPTCSALEDFVSDQEGDCENINTQGYVAEMGY